MMWLIFGILAIIFAILNIFNFKKKSDIFRFLSLSFTSLTVCAFYSDGASRLIIEDWAGLMDTMPTISNVLWILVVISILINSVSLRASYKK